MTSADMAGVSDSTDAYDAATQAAARDEGMTFENSIASAGLYLQAQAARYGATRDDHAADEAKRALNSPRLTYEDRRER